MKRILKWIVGLVLLLGAAGASAQSATPWVIGPFARPASGNPVVSPNAASTFQDPIAKAPVQWEALHTFNPAAIVHDGKVFVLYRAEDNSGEMQIGMHTSRLGLAESPAHAFENISMPLKMRDSIVRI